MLKNFIKHTLPVLVSLLFFFLIFLYEVYLGESRLSLVLNQGLSDVPHHLDNVTIKHRRGLYCILTGYDTSTSSTCTIPKEYFATWLKTAEFQVIYFTPEGSSETNYYSKIASLPDAVANNSIDYTVQIGSGNSKIIAVHPFDEKNLLLKFYSDWN